MVEVASAPPITGVLETALYVDDVARAVAFYRDVLGLKLMAGEGDLRFAALDAGPSSVLLVFRRGGTLADIALPGGTIPAHDGHGPLHFALRIPASTFEAWRSHLAANGVALTGEMKWPQGGRSLYFSDPDGHAVELATPGIWANDPESD
ncbi:Catechol 2,3-dioxygenase [Kaistia soli DSM 19436]|uniref:Catechol 2,3-dioxygenase n=1 Tax=Kaistia soli DSM 19436 TaxID=1122133 RepID=A0A1M5GWB4_9HYPH|nr:VOC family protein [Kaistia soli]SHG08013.1 Catechol 2,3-dioxygenase [Kaistia soli DSM 19436]